MKRIPLQIKLVLAILLIVCNFIMGIADAVLANDFVKCDKILRYYFGKFGYIAINHGRAKQKLLQKK